MHREPPTAPEGWVPVERRFLGLDRTTIAPAVAVLVLLIVCVWALPALDDGIARDNPAAPGDVVRLGDVVTFVPEPGWNIVSGERQGRPGLAGEYATSAVVTRAGVVVQIRTDTFAGTPAELLDRIRDTGGKLRGSAGFHVTDDASAVGTRTGLRGVAARFTGSTGNGLVAAFVVGGQGVEVVVSGPDTAGAAIAAQVAAMIQSLAPVERGAAA